MRKSDSIPDSIKESIIAHLKGDITVEQNKALQEWLVASESNRQAFDQLREIWKITYVYQGRSFDIENAWTDVKNTITSPVKTHRPKYEYHPYKKLFMKLKPALKIAAMLLLAYLAGITTLWLTQDEEESTAQVIEISAPKGSRTFLTLDDGTHVWLNAGTKLLYPKDYGRKQRNVELTGEAYFEVAKNKEVPFIVHANGVHIVALGTAFNVKAYEEEGQVETTLTEGMVRVEFADGRPDQQPVILRPNQQVTLKTKDSVTENKNTLVVTPDSDVAVPQPEPPVMSGELKTLTVEQLADTRPYTSWKDPRWVFKHQNLMELSTKLARRYDITFVFADKQLQDYVISGTLLDETLEQVLKSLQLTAPIDYTINHKTVILKENHHLKKKYQKLINN